MAKQKRKEVKQQNPVAKFAVMFNRCKKMKDKRQSERRGDVKHKRSEDYSDLSLLCA